MTRNEQRFGIIGTIGNGSELRAAPKKKVTCSYHVIADAKEKAIRYDYSLIPPVIEYEIAAYILCKPILLQEAA